MRRTCCDPATEAALTAKLDALQKDTHRQLIVATIPDLQGYPLEDYGYRLGRAWGVGLKDVNNGIILFIAPNEPAGHRGPRIEVGYGLEPVVTDALASVIINEQMMPLLKAGQVPQAMTAGTDALIEQLRASPDEAKARTDAAVAAFDKTHRRVAGSGGGGIPIGLIIWAMIIGFVILSSLRGARARQALSRRRSRRWSCGDRAWAIGDRGGGSSWSGGGSSLGRRIATAAAAAGAAAAFRAAAADRSAAAAHRGDGDGGFPLERRGSRAGHRGGDRGRSRHRRRDRDDRHAAVGRLSRHRR